MGIKQLMTFAVASQSESFTQAADALNISQASVSRRIFSLERELGLPLFHHGQRPPALTAQGRDLLEAATPFLRAVDDLIEKAAGGVPAPLTITVSSALVDTFLPSVLGLLNTPQLRTNLHVQTGSSEERVSMVLNWQADMAIVSEAEVPEQCDFRPLFEFGIALITPLGHALANSPGVSIQSLSRCSLVLPRHGSSTRRIIEAEFLRQGLKCSVAVEASSVHLIKKAVSLGLGVGLLPRLVIEAEDKSSLAVTELADSFAPIRMGVIVRRNNSDPRVAQVLRVMEQAAPQLLETVEHGRHQAQPRASAAT